MGAGAQIAQICEATNQIQRVVMACPESRAPLCPMRPGPGHRTYWVHPVRYR
jgi:hypothetical protein